MHSQILFEQNEFLIILTHSVSLVHVIFDFENNKGLCVYIRKGSKIQIALFQKMFLSFEFLKPAFLAGQFLLFTNFGISKAALFVMEANDLFY